MGLSIIYITVRVVQMSSLFCQGQGVDYKYQLGLMGQLETKAKLLLEFVHSFIIHPFIQNVLMHCWSVAKLCLTLCDPMNCSPQDSSVYRISQARILECCHFLLQIFPSQRSNPCLPHWQAGPLPSEPPGKPPRTVRCPITVTSEFLKWHPGNEPWKRPQCSQPSRWVMHMCE